MAAKQTKKVTKKPVARKAAQKAAPKKKPIAKKQAAKSKTKPRAKTQTPNALMSSSLLRQAIDAMKTTDARRPPNNPQMPLALIPLLTHDLNAFKSALEDFAAHLRSLDRMRLNGVGIKKQGFIERVFEVAVENPEFLPHYLTLEKFRQDGEYFIGIHGMVDITDQIRELLWNIGILGSDVWYTDALEYYASVREASKRRVDAAETLYRALEPFFKRSRKLGEDGEPVLTLKKLRRDENAIARGKRDGVVYIENKKPKLIGGVHKVIDEEFSDSEQFRETKERQFRE